MSELNGSVSEAEYMGQTIKTFEGKFTFPSNDPDFRDGKFLGKEFPLNVELAVHPNNSKRIIINIPGINGDIDGYADKYKVLASHMQADNLGAVIRTDNGMVGGYLTDVKLRAALQYARENAFAICGEPSPDVFLMGFSAGASAIAGVAHEYPEVKGILLYAPSGDMPMKIVKEGLKKFKGKVTIVQGEKDEIVGPQAGSVFEKMATGASQTELFMIPDCSHQFIGEANGRIMSEGPYYAFSTDSTKPKFPDPLGGIKLYD